MHAASRARWQGGAEIAAWSCRCRSLRPLGAAKTACVKLSPRVLQHPRVDLLVCSVFELRAHLSPGCRERVSVVAACRDVASESSASRLESPLAEEVFQVVKEARTLLRRVEELPRRINIPGHRRNRDELGCAALPPFDVQGSGCTARGAGLGEDLAAARPHTLVAAHHPRPPQEDAPSQRRQRGAGRSRRWSSGRRT